MIDLITLIIKIITFDIVDISGSGTIREKELLIFFVSLILWFIIYRSLTKLTGLRWER
jgi:hypothetical protein